ncbi:MAG: lysoplasmalogenase [Wenzhouxiangellaceae bacterium]|nr:lysoplasmalogenase [Wenzhouxiangellaceae bacterium]MBS3746028.1 lysoplasmalogenase [Wenzhouxiangellaceae bacterium]MBS3822390.1 lysoplasmalogenase [Wenzhouxiangellaceae bacterium]
MNVSRISPAVFAFFGVTYWLSLWTPGFAGDWAVKAAPMLLAAGVLGAVLPARFGVPMAIGFIAAAAGDIFLALDRHAYLIQGLLCFLVTQVAYAAAFLGRGMALGERLEYRLPVTVYGAVLLALMLPGLGSFMLPVFVYVSALVAMTVLAAGFESRPGRVYFGAVLFLIADSLIGIDRFVASFPFSEIVIVGIYTAAQFLIFTGMLRTLAPKSRQGKEQG